MKNLSRKDLIYAGIVLISVYLCCRFFVYIINIALIGVLSLMFATIMNRPVSFIASKGIHRTVAVFFTVILAFAVICGALNIIIPETVKETQNIKKNIPEFHNKSIKKLEKICKELNIDTEKLLESKEFSQGIKKFTPLLLNGVKKASFGTLGVLVHTVLIILIMVYILCDPRPLLTGFLNPWDFERKKILRRCLLRMEKMLFAWAMGLLAGMLCMFLLTWAGLSLIKIEGAFLFALIAGFLNIIPTLGPFIAAILPISITLVTNPINALYVLIIYILMHQVESHIMTPLIMKKQLDIHPMILILSILVMVMFFGMTGAFITAPIMASLSIIYEEFVIKTRIRRKKTEACNNEN